MNVSNTHPPPDMVPPESGVTVRMYRPNGLGDCFLLCFPTVDGRGSYMLIDFGVFFGTRGGSARMKKIAKSILDATGYRLDVLVVSHEHWDHLSGFKFAKEQISNLQIDELWLGWTEDPFHPLAKRLRERRAIALRALRSAHSLLGQMQAPEAALMNNVLAFYGGLGAGTLSTTSDLMEYVRELAASIKYRHPGEDVINLPGVEGARFYVLGPPEDEELLLRSAPSQTDSEVYELRPSLNETTGFYAAALRADHQLELSHDEDELIEWSYPFSRSNRIPLEHIQKYPEVFDFYQKHYGHAAETEVDVDVPDANGAPAWRRIENDWLNTASEFALQLDNDTNNTSLVIAIELADSGRILLFPGDAQVGNWLSWQNVSWTRGRGTESTKITGTDLLGRTSLYKVSHHASHNGTLRGLGLELMPSTDFTAMIPVDESQAVSKGWAMPASALLNRLDEKTRGRVIRADTGLPRKPDSISTQEWDRYVTAEDPSPDGLWIEVVIPDR